MLPTARVESIQELPVPAFSVSLQVSYHLRVSPESHPYEPVGQAWGPFPCLADGCENEKIDIYIAKGLIWHPLWLCVGRYMRLSCVQVSEYTTYLTSSFSSSA